MKIITKQEVWRDIPNYKGSYQISDLGNVKSLERKSWNGKSWFILKERILKKRLNVYGYYTVNLSMFCKTKTHQVHQCVAISFLNHTPCRMKLVVNHKNFIKTDNRICNIEIVTARENCNQKHIPSSSKYTGVTYIKTRRKWRASIFLNKKPRFLGEFTNEYDAHLAYEKALKLSYE